METLRTFLPFWSIVTLLIIAFVFSLLGRTEAIVVSILGLLYVAIRFGQLLALSKIKDDLDREITRILELVGENREIIQKRREKTTARKEISAFFDIPIENAVEGVFLFLVVLLCLFVLFYTVVPVPWKQLGRGLLAAMIAIWQAMIAMWQALTP